MKRVIVDGSGDRFAEALDRVAADREVVITRPGRRSVVLVPLADYEALNETVHLLRSPANSRRLLEATARLDARPS